MDAKHRWMLLVVAGALALPMGLGGQQASADAPIPGLVALHQYECPNANLQAAAGTLNGLRGQIAQQLVNEGLLLDYQIWVRRFGDEWNLVEYFLAEDDEAFDYAIEELSIRYQVADSGGRQAQSVDALCPRRRDNLFAVVGEIP